MKTVDVLRKAKNLIKRYGWVQGRMGSKDVGFCTLGALNGVSPMPTLLGAHRAREYLKAAIAINYTPIHEWNDRKTTSKGLVLSVFDKAIKNAKRRHINGGR